MKILNSLKSILWFVFVAGTLSFAQVDQAGPVDSQFTQSFGVDSVNLQNLSVGINVPIINRPGAIPFSYSLGGVSACATVQDGASPIPNKYAVCGIGTNKDYFYGSIGNFSLSGIKPSTPWTVGFAGRPSTSFCAADGNKTVTTYRSLYAVSSDYEIFYLPSTDTLAVEVGGSSCAISLDDYTTQGHIHIVATNLSSVSVTLPSGFTYGSAFGVQDTFGNKITGLVDTLGTAALTVTSPGTGEVDTYHDTTGAAQSITSVLGAATTIKTAFSCGTAPNNITTSAQLLSEIDYPDGNNLYFTYEPISGGVTGRVRQITYRTGGTATYTYGSIVSCTSLIPSSLSRATQDGTTTYTLAVFGSGPWGTTTTVLDPGKNKTIYTFMGNGPDGNVGTNQPLTLTQVQVYQNTGTVAAPAYTLLSTTIYCYNGNSTACPTTQAAYPITQKDTYVAPGSKTTYSRVKQTFDTYGNVLTSARYDFTTLGGGTPVTTTAITYGSWNGSACVAVGSGIVNLPCDVKTTDSAPHTLSESRHTYSSKGFETQTQNWTGSLWITSTATPNVNGTVNTITSPTGALTAYFYDATGSGGCNTLLPTRKTTSFGNERIIDSATWDCNGGRVLSSTDVNGGVSHFTYDPLFRPLSQSDPTTYEIDESYPTATTATVSDPYISTTVKVDGLGRTIRTQTTDGASYDTVSAGYGFNGTQFQTSSSQPCLVGLNVDCTKVHFGVSDPLGRSISSSTTSNETVTTSYTQNDVSTTLGPTTPLQTGQTEYDGLGRPKSTCALQTTGGTACGQAMGGAGILTTYSYSFGAGTRTSTATRGSQTHTAVSDALGRPNSVTTPEAGTTTYTYDSYIAPDECGSRTVTGLLAKVTYPDGSRVCYDYDTLGRVTDTGHSTAAECKRFRYDTTSNAIYTAPTGYSANNIIGRLVEASTDDCTFPFSQAHMISDEWFAYDDAGRVTDVWETTPHSGGWYHTTAGYAPGGQLLTFSGVPGKSTYTVTLDPNGRPDSSTLGATSLVTNVNYNAANQVTSFSYGSSGGNDAFTFNQYTGRMATYTYTVGAATDKGTLTWNPNGTLKTLAIVDGLNAGGTQTCNFTYDDLARLLTDNCGAIWNQSYAYDQYDNFSKSGSTNWNPGYNSTITCPTGTICNHITGANYDGAGRVTYDLNSSYSWDSYGKMASANAGASVGSCGSGGVTCVTYDAFGRPAEKQVAGTFTEFLYSPLGLTGVMNGQTVTYFRLPLPGGASLNGNAANANQIQHYDWLGSARLVTSLAGSVTLDAAYTPYGEKYAQFGSSLLQNFTGDFQDLYAGLFDTPNREFDQAAGSRWLSPDPAHASWNAYSYPTNPNSATDPSGLEPRQAGTIGATPSKGAGCLITGGDCGINSGAAFSLEASWYVPGPDDSSGFSDEITTGIALAQSTFPDRFNDFGFEYAMFAGPGLTSRGASSDWGSSNTLASGIDTVSRWLGVPASVDEAEHAAGMAQLVTGAGDAEEVNQMLRSRLAAQSSLNEAGREVSEKIWNWYGRVTSNFQNMGPYFNHYITKVGELASKEGPYQAHAIKAGNAWLRDGVDVQNAILNSGNLADYFNGMGVPKYEIEPMLSGSYAKRGLYFGW
jgi:RHS repeat-associated protein